jgi:hypothetical protein
METQGRNRMGPGAKFASEGRGILELVNSLRFAP